MTLQSGDPVFCGSRRLILGPLLKSGGAGSIHLLHDEPHSVAKIYHGHVDAALAQRRVEAMLRLAPQLPDIAEDGRHYVQLAWPTALLRDGRDAFRGYLMPMVDVAATSELEAVLQERQARAAGLPTGLGAKVALAANLSAVVAELHRQGHYVVDLKPVNLRFYKRSLYLALLDCDGFSVQGGEERFAAMQMTPDYLAPEFQSGPMAPGPQEERQDRFALAVVIFQLLNFGIHPFSGRPASEAVPSDLPGRIRGRCYAYGLQANAAIAPNPASGHEAMPLLLRSMFDRAFTSRDARPDALEWSRVLSAYASRSKGMMMPCKLDSGHQHFSGMPCAACRRDALIHRAVQQNATVGPATRPVAAKVVKTSPPAIPPFHARRGAALPPASSGPGELFRLLKKMFDAALLLAVVLSFVLAWLASQDIFRHPQRRAVESGHTDGGSSLDGNEEVHGLSARLLQAAAYADREVYAALGKELQRASSNFRKGGAGDRDSAAYEKALERYRETSMQPGNEGLAKSALLRAVAADAHGVRARHELALLHLAEYLRMTAGEPKKLSDGFYEKVSEDVEREFLQVIRLDPTHASAWYGLARLYMDRERIDRAVGALVVSLWLRSPDSSAVEGAVAASTARLPPADGPSWAILEARARQSLAWLRQQAVPAEVASLASMPWPGGDPGPMPYMAWR